ncbi:MAG: hypothetical protein COU33_00675 [Candidatus Magasanikbacteria bacterium CG10_big_fil_rev_8_21_14_0_10_43_6]|uniref:Uncharacterized protein n=1 Tax=Candidatus Magasanikbacteria bacterium CG10_big_fil_rev_8_21_14_0_10_43_6 TaxID=1974650 RepID=A0A2M6W254_9BACT|nr:MAG: hypothetical protein COU33_00675 [Candidatus Magasanikbacteria bacterium CG10_big_fil_rev_8_21_14_0_10_43_6]
MPTNKNAKRGSEKLIRAFESIQGFIFILWTVFSILMFAFATEVMDSQDERTFRFLFESYFMPGTLFCLWLYLFIRSVRGIVERNFFVRAAGKHYLGLLGVLLNTIVGIIAGTMLVLVVFSNLF